MKYTWLKPLRNQIADLNLKLKHGAAAPAGGRPRPGAGCLSLPKLSAYRESSRNSIRSYSESDLALLPLPWRPKNSR